MSTPQNSIEEIREQAARWVVRVTDGELNEVDREEMQHWLMVDPRHAEEFRAENAIIGMAAELPLAVHPQQEESTREDIASGKARRRAYRLTITAAATLAMALVMGGLFAWYAQAKVIVTGTGQTRAVTFEDGSIAYLNTKTRLQWRGNPTERRVALLEGEALFEVMHDSTRPFRVELDSSEIQVLGTRFNVYRKKSGDVIVTVLEGRVRVQNRAADLKAVSTNNATPGWQRNLRANQQIAYRDTGFIRDVHTTDARIAVKWRDGVLEMQEGTLAEMVEELTRYTDRPVFISDPRLAELRLSGALNIRDVRAALARIENIAPVAVRENGSTFTLDYRYQEREENE